MGNGQHGKNIHGVLSGSDDSIPTKGHFYAEGLKPDESDEIVELKLVVKKVILESIAELPKYVCLGEGGTTLRLSDYNEYTGYTYWKDAGRWGVGCKRKDGKLITVSDREGLSNKELVPTTKKSYMKDNEGYT